MAPVLWVIAVLGTVTVIHRMIYTFDAAKSLQARVDEENRVALKAAEEAHPIAS
jgi:CDP-diacylglycerol--glycerol-3-phosphate 3-phosphatidyltransferase